MLATAHRSAVYRGVAGVLAAPLCRSMILRVTLVVFVVPPLLSQVAEGTQAATQQLRRKCCAVLLDIRSIKKGAFVGRGGGNYLFPDSCGQTVLWGGIRRHAGAALRPGCVSSVSWPESIYTYLVAIIKKLIYKFACPVPWFAAVDTSSGTGV